MLQAKGDNCELLYSKKINKKDKVVLEERNKENKMTIMSDAMFKTMFQNEKRLKYSCRFISDYLDISYEELLKNIRLGKNELDKKYENDKGERCDYVANINGSSINIEVNNNSDEITMERNIEYVFRLYTSKIKKIRKNTNIRK